MNAVSPLDRLYLERAYELAARGVGDTSPNPPVGAVVVRDGVVIGEGYHHRAGEAHAETIALAAAGDASGATLYVSLEPCNHTGRTPPCTHAIVKAGIARVVIGALDPNPKTNGGGVAYLQQHNIETDVVNDRHAMQLVEMFARSLGSGRPFISLKMAMSLDGYVTSEPDVQEWLSGEEARARVRELRITHDAVMVGAGTVRVDDPQLTVRPPHDRGRPYVRIVAAQGGELSADRQVFATAPGYAKTIVLAPTGARERFAGLESIADVLYVGAKGAAELDLGEAMRKLAAERSIQSIFCEGGPTLAGALIAAGLVDRASWIVAPKLMRGERAVPAVTGLDFATLGRRLHFDRIEPLGDDVMISGTFIDV